MTELKPCPFCGCEDCLITERESSGGFLWFFGVCPSCQTEGPAVRQSSQGNIDDYNYLRAVEKWNTRHEPKAEGGK